jgi:uncharacterized membrane protein
MAGALHLGEIAAGRRRCGVCWLTDAHRGALAAVNKRVLFRVMLVLAVIGLGDATYLTIVHYAGIAVICTTKHNSCQQVQTSQYSHVAGVPVALLGLIGYIMIVGSLLVREREFTRLATLALTLTGFGFSVFLTYQETFTIPGHPIYCEWCVGSAIILTILFPLSVVRYLTTPPASAQAPRAEVRARARARR